jgi:3-dehydroquinate synthase
VQTDPQRFDAGSGSQIVVGRGLEIALPERSDRESVAILAQPGIPTEVATRIAESLPGLRTGIFPLPDREAAKDLDAVGDVYDQFVEFNLGRHDTIVGVGGGAATDVAGFVAATWLRGVESVLVPTTLLGAVDASIGGKTGVNRRGKNLVGAFWSPTRVFVDLDTLDALPPGLRLEGAAEIIKAGFIRDIEIVTAYESSGIEAPLDFVVPRAVEVKTSIVRDDLRESGDRTLLNFGHTIGHAVEMLTGTPHGHAVSIGMVAAAAVSRARFGFDEGWLTHVLFSTGLPVAAAGVSLDASMDLIARDKKRIAEGIRMVLLRAPGVTEVTLVTEPEIVMALEAIGAT